LLDSSPIWRQLLLQAALILLNAFFAATEIAVLSLNENKVRKQSEEGDKRAAKLLKIIEQPTTFLSTIQVGITLAGFLGSAFAADNFASLLTDWLVNDIGLTGISASALNTISVIVITLILSYFTLVLGELVPKRIAMQKPNAIIKISLSVVRFLSIVLRPITWFLSISTNGVLRLLGIDPNKEAEEVSEEEIRMMVDIGEESGTIESGEKEMIENIFEFNNNTAEDVMIHRTDMEIIWLDDTPEQILARIQETGLSRFPVCDEDIDDVVGLLATREYLLNSQLPQPKPLKELLRAPYFVPESIHTDVLFRKMQEMKCHMAIVVDEYGGTSGLITMEDLLECIVGNIYDEFDPQEEQEITKLSDNLWKVAGSVELDDLAEALAITLPEEEEYDTLGGLILDHLNAIPEDGTTFSLDLLGMHIEVLEIQDRRIEWTNISLLPKEEADAENAD
jgi:putative hemolysin